MTDGIILLPARAEHYGFALSLYLETMAPYTRELMVWDEAKQTASFQHQWRPEDARIIQRDADQVGWLQVHETASDIMLEHFYIAPRFHNRGAGGAVLTRICQEARANGKPVVLTVLKNNPARRLYERFGFSVVGEEGVKFSMRLTP